MEKITQIARIQENRERTDAKQKADGHKSRPLDLLLPTFYFHHSRTSRGFIQD
jgi:hypothetical protein